MQNFHQAIGHPNLLLTHRIIPGESSGFIYSSRIWEPCKMLGFHHFRYIAKDESTTKEGTMLVVNDINGIVYKAIKFLTTLIIHS